MTGTVTFLKRYVFILVVWLILTANDPSAWIVGLLVSTGVTLLSLRLLPPTPREVRPVAVLALLPGFLWGSLRGGVDVARRALDPRLPLKRGWVHYPLRLQGSAARVSLGNLLSLMPGTLAAGCSRDTLLVHCLDVELSGGDTIADQEIRIARTLGIRLEPVDD
jgi:multicomponent Na+:H+ antiporter subunit E